MGCMVHVGVIVLGIMSEEAQAFPITVIFPMLGEVTTVDKFEIAS